MIWRRVDRLTGANPLTDFDHAVRSRVAVAFTAVFTLMGLVNALVLTFVVDGEPGMAELGVASALVAAVIGGLGLRLRRPNLVIGLMIGLGLAVLLAAAWANRGSFPPGTLYLPGIILGAYIAWGMRGLAFIVPPIAVYFGIVAWYGGAGPGRTFSYSPEEMLNILVLAAGFSCVWIVLFGSSFRSATTEAQRVLSNSNQRLERALAEAREANRAKSEFIANMSHEVRTPLNGVLGMTSVLLEDRKLSDHHRRSLGLIDESGQHLLHLLNEILDLSKIEAGGLELEDGSFDLGRLVDNAATHWRPQADAKGVELTLSSQIPHDFVVAGDALRFRQIVNNLLANAVKFTNAGKISVMLREKSDPDTGRSEITLSVRDSGIGIARDKQDLIFDAFSQVDTSTTRKYGGTGLGLTICRRLARKMGGDLTVSSDLGRGSTFTLSLPMTVASPDPAEEIEEIAAPQTLDIPARILVVDDVKTNQIVMQAMVKQICPHSDTVIDIASGGREAVNKAASFTYDVVFMDVQMPEMDGVSAMHCIREGGTSGDAMIVAVTALASDDHRREFAKEGFDAYLPKPVELNALRSVLEVLLTRETRAQDGSDPATGRGTGDTPPRSASA